MTSRQRMLTALKGGIPDRLPVTTHHLMPYFLNRTMGGMGVQEFFDRFGLDPIHWVVAHKPDLAQDDYIDPGQGTPGYLEPVFMSSDSWRIERENLSEKQTKILGGGHSCPPESRLISNITGGQECPPSKINYEITRYRFVTPSGTLSMVLQSDERTAWVVEPMFKKKSDLDVFAQYAPSPLCDVDEVNRMAEAFGERGIIRGAIPGFDIYGQPGCWQDLAVQFGIESLIMETFADPEWVKAALKVFIERKKRFLSSCKDAKHDLLELGGGSASTTVISPAIFEEFVAPNDAELIDLAHTMGQRVVYHTCGGMMPILEMIAGMNPDAMETFTPPGMGGDTDLAEARRRIGDHICMIGGFDQFHFLKGCSQAETRREVRRCFEAAGENGGFILAPSDHFFEADIECLEAFADEARKCVY